MHLTRSTYRILTVCLFALLAARSADAQPSVEHNLKFDRIPVQWDRGLPLGNGMCGVLVWEREGKLRLSLDRADLWDLRPTAEIEKYSYAWAYQHKLKRDWDTVWKVADEPYDRDPAPTKLPGAAVEFDISRMGPVVKAELDLATAVCTIRWKNGTTFRIFVDAVQPVVRYSWKRAELVPGPVPVPVPVLVAPPYGAPADTSKGNQVVDGMDLRRLGYAQGGIRTQNNLTVYDQKGWGSFSYQAALLSIGGGSSSQGVISLSAHYADRPPVPAASEVVTKAAGVSFDDGAVNHKAWWRDYWSRASLVLPDKMLEKQWYLETYKFGAASRTGAPPISLQAVWTADNGKLPPWKGDFHNDLNTQLSYWPAYSGNHLAEASVFTDWLWEHKPSFESYSKQVFGVEGVNVPGVATLRGEMMGGWHMYAMSPTVSCWLAQHFYMQWRFGMDRGFLVQRAYPWVKAAATYIEHVTVSTGGKRTLPMSSSPEFNDGGIDAWFLEMTNYDRAMCRYVFLTAADMAADAGFDGERAHWSSLAAQIPAFDIDAETGLTIAPGFPYKQSHRHFSHLMAVHPLGLLKYDNAADRAIMERSVANLEKQGTSQWVGYSFAWLGNIHARMHDGEKAADVLTKFARCFCSENSFHLNGDVCKSGLSTFTYQPFTLEGNFAFASGIQEMLLQSHAGYIDVFPAVPAAWADVSFSNLRADGAVLVSAARTGGSAERLVLVCEQGGMTRVKLPFAAYTITAINGATVGRTDNGIASIRFDKGGRIELAKK